VENPDTTLHLHLSLGEHTAGREFAIITYEPSPEFLKTVLRRSFVVSLGFDIGDVSDEVHVLGFDGMLAIHEATETVKHEEDEEGEILGDEAGDNSSEWGLEVRETLLTWDHSSCL
jgi:hypothetical protein